MHLGGHVDVEIRLVSSLPMGPTLFPCLLLAYSRNGDNIASSGCGKYKYMYVPE